MNTENGSEILPNRRNPPKLITQRHQFPMSAIAVPLPLQFQTAKPHFGGGERWMTTLPLQYLTTKLESNGVVLLSRIDIDMGFV